MSTQTSFVTPTRAAKGLRVDGGPRDLAAVAPRGERPRPRGRFAEGPADRACARPLRHHRARRHLPHRLCRAAAGGGVRIGFFERHQRLFLRARRAGGAVRDPADAAGGGDFRRPQSGVRRARRLGDREIRISRQDLPDHADRPAVLGQPRDLGPRLRAAVRRAGLLGRVAAGARHSHPVRGAGHCARDHLRDVSLSSPARSFR